MRRDRSGPDDDRTFDWALAQDGPGDGAGDDPGAPDGSPDGAPDGAPDGGADRAEAGRRARNGRRLLVACLVGGVVVVVLAVLGTRAVVHELRRPGTHERLVDAIHDRYQGRFDRCLARGTGVGPCATQAEQACADDPRWTLSDASKAITVCTFVRAR